MPDVILLQVPKQGGVGRKSDEICWCSLGLGGTTVAEKEAVERWRRLLGLAGESRRARA
jgi:hypothetical protein